MPAAGQFAGADLGFCACSADNVAADICYAIFSPRRSRVIDLLEPYQQYFRESLHGLRIHPMNFICWRSVRCR